MAVRETGETGSSGSRGSAAPSDLAEAASFTGHCRLGPTLKHVEAVLSLVVALGNL